MGIIIITERAEEIKKNIIKNVLKRMNGRALFQPVSHFSDNNYIQNFGEKLSAINKWRSTDQSVGAKAEE